MTGNAAARGRCGLAGGNARARTTRVDRNRRGAGLLSRDTTCKLPAALSASRARLLAQRLIAGSRTPGNTKGSSVESYSRSGTRLVFLGRLAISSSKVRAPGLVPSAPSATSPVRQRSHTGQGPGRETAADRLATATTAPPHACAATMLRLRLRPPRVQDRFRLRRTPRSPGDGPPPATSRDPRVLSLAPVAHRFPF